MTKKSKYDEIKTALLDEKTFDKIYNEDFADLVFEYEVTKIVYSNGTQE